MTSDIKMIEEIEHAFISLVEGKIEDMGYNHSSFMRQAFPDLPEKTAIRRWQRMRSGGQRLWLADAAAMSAALNEPLSGMLFQAEQLAKTKKPKAPNRKAVNG